MRTFRVLQTGLICLAIILLSVSGFAQPKPQLMPAPKSLEYGNGSFYLNKDFTVNVTGNPDQRMFNATSRFLRRLSDKTGLFLSQGFVTGLNQSPDAALQINIERPGKVALHEDESYQISITEEGIRVTAATDLGGMHALETLIQFVYSDSERYFYHAAEINDAPRFPWRGLLMDVSRHFMPVDVVKRNLDGMAAVKLNVLHWHLSEDQGFRVESKAKPKLHELGSDGFYYTQEQIKDIVQYAADRGIRVMPEFDVPGHATSWCVAYPELASAPGPYEIERHAGVFNPTLDPTKEETYEFLETVFTEMAGLFPDPYFHIGGDENNGKQWDENADIQAFMKENGLKDNHELQTHFNKRLLKILTNLDKKMMGWDEILQPDLPKDAIIHSWRGKQYLFQAAEDGYQTVLSNGYYIDLLHSAANHYAVDPIPEGTEISEKARQNILGGEATMWAELVTKQTVDSRIWPRTAAIAERFWSPGSVTDLTDMFNRLEIISHELDQLGLTHISNRERIVRGLANGSSTAPIWTLVNVAEPLKGYTRNPGGTYYKKLLSFHPVCRCDYR